MRKMQIAIVLLRNDDDEQILGNFANISIIPSSRYLLKNLIQDG